MFPFIWRGAYLGIFKFGGLLQGLERCNRGYRRRLDRHLQIDRQRNGRGFKTGGVILSGERLDYVTTRANRTRREAKSLPFLCPIVRFFNLIELSPNGFLNALCEPRTNRTTNRANHRRTNRASQPTNQR